VFSQVAYHIHQRKRIHEKHEPYPHPNPNIRRLDRLVMVIAMIYPFTAIPQILKIWETQDASGISLVTWSLWLILAIPMLAYGIVHKTKLLIVMYSLWTLIHIIVILSALKFS